jgi:hypothetical protein
MPRDYRLEKEITDTLEKYSTNLEWDNVFYSIDVTKGSKRIKVRWVFPARWLRFRFFVEDIKIYDTFAHYGKSMSLADVWGNIANVIIRFLNLPEHVITRGRWRKVTYLEVNDNGQWVDIFINFRRNTIKRDLHKTSRRYSIDLPSDPQLEKDITDVFSEYSPRIEWDDDVYHLFITKGTKQIKVVWAYKVSEVNFDFFEDDIKIYTDWIDFYEGETTSEIFNLITFLVNRFVNLPSRVVTEGRWLRTTNLEVCENGQWVNIYDHYSKK